MVAEIIFWNLTYAMRTLLLLGLSTQMPVVQPVDVARCCEHLWVGACVHVHALMLPSAGACVRRAYAMVACVRGAL